MKGEQDIKLKLTNMEATIVDTKEVVKMLWIGFDLIIIQHNNGKQEAVRPKVLGRKPRPRPRAVGYRKI